MAKIVIRKTFFLAKLPLIARRVIRPPCLLGTKWKTEHEQLRFQTLELTLAVSCLRNHKFEKNKMEIGTKHKLQSNHRSYGLPL